MGFSEIYDFGIKPVPKKLRKLYFAVFIILLIVSVIFAIPYILLMLIPLIPIYIFNFKKYQKSNAELNNKDNHPKYIYIPCKNCGLPVKVAPKYAWMIKDPKKVTANCCSPDSPRVLGMRGQVIEEKE